MVPDPGNPQDLNRYAYVRNNPLRYTDPTGHCIPGVNCPGMPREVEPPPGPAGLTRSAYAAWLTHYLLWLEQQTAETGGMLDLALGQQTAAAELSTYLLEDPTLLQDLLYQEVVGSGPQLAGAVAGASSAILSDIGGWVLGAVRQAWPRFRDLPTQPGLERHHLVEKRFAEALQVRPDDLPADYVQPQEHRGPGSVTSKLRQRLPYGKEHGLEAIWEAHRKVYEKMGRLDWLEAIRPYFEALGVKR